MKNGNVFLAAVMLLVIAVSLCACGAEPAAQESGYTVTVLDDTGAPVAGAMVQLCSNVCVPGVTDAEGIARFDLPEGDYKAAFIALPDGYTYMDEVQEFSFAEGGRELTITLKRA